MGKDRERLRQFLQREIFGRSPGFDRLRHTYPKILCLFDEAPGSERICFGRVSEIKAKEVFFIADAHMEAVAIIRRIRNKPAIFQDHPFPRWISRAKTGRG